MRLVARCDDNRPGVWSRRRHSDPREASPGSGPPLVALLVIALAVTMDGPASAAPLTAGNLLVASEGELREYARDGGLVQRHAVPDTGSDGYPHPRSVLVDESGLVQVFNGTFDPYLSTWNPQTGDWSHHTADSWSIAGITYNGGIASWDRYIYAPDQTTSGDLTFGIIRFDQRAGYSWERILTGQRHIDLSMGLDGRLYALRSSAIVIDVYDPLSLQALDTIVLPQFVARIAVGADGTIFAASWSGGGIQRFDPRGALTASVGTGNCAMTDVDVAADGTVVATGFCGLAYVTDRDFAPPRIFPVGQYSTFVTIVPTEAPTPAVRRSWGALKHLYR